MFDTQIMTLLSGNIFYKVLNNQSISYSEYSLLTAALVAKNIPFDVAFTSGSRKEAAAIQLTIHINPSMTIVIVISLEAGSNSFSPSP